MAHKNAREDLTQEFLRSVLDYDQKTGMFRWKIRLAYRGPVGAIAGTPRKNEKGRIKIGIRNKEYFAHRLAWLWMTGKWPIYEIDHENENQSDNSWKNLREATPMQNHGNRGAQKNNTSGYKGVCYVKSRDRWIAGIKIAGRRKHLGVFDCPKEARAAYVKAAKKYFGEFAKF